MSALGVRAEKVADATEKLVSAMIRDIEASLPGGLAGELAQVGTSAPTWRSLAERETIGEVRKCF